jgi:hypothetical protein
MRHTLLIAFTATLPLYLGGCVGGNETASSPSPVVVPTDTQSIAVPNATVSPSPSPAASPNGNLPADLIASTNATQRVIRVLRNRPDPFALLPTTPSVEILPNATPPQPVPSVPQILPLPGSGSLAPIPRLIPTPAVIAPPPFQPTLARSVKVTGIVQIGNVVHAIVDAPNEPSSRYVQVGQRLSNGQILVKRIEMNQGSEPVVVLEQNGVEVMTAVGEGGAASTTPTASAGNTSSPG